MFDENIIIYARRNWINAKPHEYEFELELKLLNWYVLSLPATNTHKPISGAPASQQILSYINSRANLHELDCFVFDLSAVLAATLATAIVTKTENTFHANPFIPGSTQAAQSATNTLPYNNSNIDDTCVETVRNAVIECVFNVIFHVFIMW